MTTTTITRKHLNGEVTTGQVVAVNGKIIASVTHNKSTIARTFTNDQNARAWIARKMDSHH